MKLSTTNTIQEIIEAYLTLGKEGYSLDIDTERNTAICNRISKRSKMGYKKAFAYGFGTEEKMIEYIVKYFNNKVEDAEKQLKVKEERKKKDSEALDNIKVGDIFCYSWGWEQTNVNFYKVIERKGKISAVVREISYKSVETTSWASENVVPCPEEVIGKEETVRLNGNYFKRSCGYARKTNATDKHYRSWYA